MKKAAEILAEENACLRKLETLYLLEWQTVDAEEFDQERLGIILARKERQLELLQPLQLFCQENIQTDMLSPELKPVQQENQELFERIKLLGQKNIIRLRGRQQEMKQKLVKVKQGQKVVTSYEPNYAVPVMFLDKRR